MKADKNNFQFRADNKESDEAVRLLGLSGLAQRDGFWFGKENGRLIHSGNMFPDIPVVKPSTALSLLQPFDKNNFCVDIQKEQDSPLLPKFKEWFLKDYGIQFETDYQYWAVLDSDKTRMNKINESLYPMITLSALRQHYPEIWEGEKEQWKPEQGEEVLFMGKTLTKKDMTFIDDDDDRAEYRFTTKDGLHIGEDQKGCLYMSRDIRPIRTLRDEIVSEIFDWVYKNEKPLDLADRIIALIEQKRGKG